MPLQDVSTGGAWSYAEQPAAPPPWVRLRAANSVCPTRRHWLPDNVGRRSKYPSCPRVKGERGWGEKNVPSGEHYGTRSPAFALSFSASCGRISWKYRRIVCRCPSGIGSLSSTASHRRWYFL